MATTYVSFSGRLVQEAVLSSMAVRRVQNWRRGSAARMASTRKSTLFLGRRCSCVQDRMETLRDLMVNLLESPNAMLLDAKIADSRVYQDERTAVV